MKFSSTDSSHDQNWQWPEKTWFRERLNAVKARESEQRRKPLASASGRGSAGEPAAAEKPDLKVD
jgi:hypothetical protein